MARSIAVVLLSSELQSIPAEIQLGLVLNLQTIPFYLQQRSSESTENGRLQGRREQLEYL
jgi:hypothetical protein